MIPGKLVKGMGGAMDLVAGVKRVVVMMEHVTKRGDHRIVPRCTYPLTGIGCVARIYTELAVIDVTPEGLVALEWVEGLSFESLQSLTGAPLRRA